MTVSFQSSSPPHRPFCAVTAGRVIVVPYRGFALPMRSLATSSCRPHTLTYSLAPRTVASPNI